MPAAGGSWAAAKEHHADWLERFAGRAAFDEEIRARAVLGTAMLELGDPPDRTGRCSGRASSSPTASERRTRPRPNAGRGTGGCSAMRRATTRRPG